MPFTRAQLDWMADVSVAILRLINAEAEKGEVQITFDVGLNSMVMAAHIAISRQLMAAGTGQRQDLERLLASLEQQLRSAGFRIFTRDDCPAN